MAKTPPKMIFCALDWTVLFTPFGSSKACWNLGCHLVVILQFCCTYTVPQNRHLAGALRHLSPILVILGKSSTYP
jgi:hypothetical protein